MNARCLTLTYMCVAAVWSASAAEPWKLRTGPRRTALIELFTSEGCSSCPPAEKWLGTLADQPGLWRDFVPVAFHVDYWDGLGWPDRFASAENTHRQERYAAQWRSRGVYTPGFVLNGAEWREWGNHIPKPDSDAGILEVGATGTNQFTVSFQSPRGRTDGLKATVVWLGSNLASKVRRGENAGRTLRHDFIVLRLSSGPLAGKEGAATGTFTLPRPEARDSGKLAVATWVSRHDELAPMQAVGGWWVPEQ